MGICDSKSNNFQNKPASNRADTLILNNDVIISNIGGNIDDVYKKIKILGEGSYGKVWLVRHETLGKEFALKIIKKKRSIDKKVENEIKILTKLDHPFILKIMEFNSTPEEYHLITDYCPNGELFNEINNRSIFSEREASFIIYQILLAIRYCHKMGVVHRDIKPENIMIEKREASGLLRVKLIDFGVSKIFNQGGRNSTIVGSGLYMAPEVILGNYNESCDLWSIGVIMYILLVGSVPFKGVNDNDNNASRENKKGRYNTSNPTYQSLSENAKDLISKLLKYEPNERITAENALKHPWFNTDDIRNIDYLDYEIIKGLLSNLEKYKSSNLIKCSVMAYLVHINSNIKEYTDASKLFNSLDLDHDGKLDKTELKNAFIKYFSLSEEQAINKVNYIFKNIDTDKNQLLESEEFIRGCINPDIFYSPKYLKVAFDHFDIDCNGKISISEIEEKFFQNSKIGSKSKEKLQIMFNQMDVNKDGYISFDEFSYFIKGAISY